MLEPGPQLNCYAAGNLAPLTTSEGLQTGRVSKSFLHQIYFKECVFKRTGSRRLHQILYLPDGFLRGRLPKPLL